MSVINEFGFRVFASFLGAVHSQIKIRKNQRQHVFRFYCWQHIWAHISGHECDKWIRFSVVCIMTFGRGLQPDKIKEKWATKSYPFLLRAACFVPYLGSRV